MKGGVPPTLRNARTGELTPPGISVCARAKSASDLARSIPDRFLTRDHSMQEEVHDNFIQGAVEIAQQASFQPEVRLGAGEQVLHQRIEPCATPDERDHLVRNRAEQKPAHKDALGETGTELQVG